MMYQKYLNGYSKEYIIQVEESVCRHCQFFLSEDNEKNVVYDEEGYAYHHDCFLKLTSVFSI